MAAIRPQSRPAQMVVMTHRAAACRVSRAQLSEPPQVRRDQSLHRRSGWSRRKPSGATKRAAVGSTHADALPPTRWCRARSSPSRWRPYRRATRSPTISTRDQLDAPHAPGLSLFYAANRKALPIDNAENRPKAAIRDVCLASIFDLEIRDLMLAISRERMTSAAGVTRRRPGNRRRWLQQGSVRSRGFNGTSRCRALFTTNPQHLDMKPATLSLPNTRGKSHSALKKHHPLKSHRGFWATVPD